MHAKVWLVKFREDQPASLLGRFLSMDGSGTEITDSNGRSKGKCLQQADLSAISVKVYDVTNDNTVTLTATPSVASTIFDTLQTLGWPHDDDGYNFRYDAAAAAFPTGRNIYLVEVILTTTGSTPIYGQWKGPAEAVQGS